MISLYMSLIDRVLPSFCSLLCAPARAPSGQLPLPFGRFAPRSGATHRGSRLAARLTPCYCRTPASPQRALGQLTRRRADADTRLNGLTPGPGQLTRCARLMMVVLEEHAEEPRQRYDDQPCYHWSGATSSLFAKKEAYASSSLLLMVRGSNTGPFIRKVLCDHALGSVSPSFMMTM